MKKTLLLSLAAMGLMSSMDANAEYRKWDFNWSAATEAQVKAADDWTNDEKGDGSSNVVPDDACVWNVGANVAAVCDAEGNLLAGGTVIAETQGLHFTALGAKKVAIAFDYTVTTDANKWGPYNGPRYLWLNGKTTAVHFTIPAVEPGTVIKMGIESHKPSDARGIDLYVGGTKLAWTSEQTGYPTTYDEYTWVTPDGDAPVDVDVQPSNGTHIYFIEVGEDNGSQMEDINIAYLYDATYNGAKDADKNPVGYLANGGLDMDPVYASLTSYNVTPIDYSSVGLSSDELNDSLLTFDLVVASEAVSSGNALAKGLVNIVNKVPMLNLKSFMYKKGVWTWGAGVNPSPKANTLIVAEDYLEDPLFADITLDENGAVQIFKTSADETPNGNMLQGYTVTEGSLIDGDAVIATAGGANAIHVHGTKNQYMLIPLSSDNLIANDDYNLTDEALILVDNAVKILAATKSKVQNAAQPIVSQTPADGSTYVEITCTTPGSVIYYTIDGTEPTTASPVYSEGFTVTEDGLVVKAFAIAHGYNDSNVTTATISVLSQAEAPVLSVENAEGMTTLTLTAAEGTLAYFSFNGVTAKTSAQTYTEPVVIREPATITYFAEGEGKLTSAIQSQEITVGGIPVVKDTVAHFTANEEEWFSNAVIKNFAMEEQELPTSNWAAKAAYYWGKSAWSYYSEEVDHTEPVVDEEGNPVLDMNGNDSIRTVYKPNPEAVKYVYSNVDTQWRLRSQGQVLTGETNVAASMAVGNGNTGYYAETAADLIGEPSKGKMTFGGKGSGEPYTASIESTVKFQPPFDVVTYLTNGGTGEPCLMLQTSVDGENWVDVAQLSNATTQRYYKKDRNHVEGTEELYVRVAQTAGASKGQLYDIYVITTEGSTGIEQIADDQRQDTRSYDLFGREQKSVVAGKLFIQNGKKMIVK